MVVSAQSSSISTNQHSFLSSVADTVLVGHPYGTSARDRSCHTTGQGQQRARMPEYLVSMGRYWLVLGGTGSVWAVLVGTL